MTPRCFLPVESDSVDTAAGQWALSNAAQKIAAEAGLKPQPIADYVNGRWVVVNGWPLWVWDAANDAIQNPETVHI